MPERPGIGVTNGRLSDCPKGRCGVSTQDARCKAAPIDFDGDVDAARARILEIVEAMPRSRVQAAEGNYVHAEFRSRVFRFVDDVEFLIDESVIHFRSAARMGNNDLGVNRRRMESIRALFETKKG